MKKYGFVVTLFLHYLVCWRLGFVDKIRIEDIKLVSLHDLRGRVVRAVQGVRGVVEEAQKCSLVVGLVVLVPFVAGMHAVEVPRLSGSVLVFPVV